MLHGTRFGYGEYLNAMNPNIVHNGPSYSTSDSDFLTIVRSLFDVFLTFVCTLNCFDVQDRSDKVGSTD